MFIFEEKRQFLIHMCLTVMYPKFNLEFARSKFNFGYMTGIFRSETHTLFYFRL